MEFTPRICIIWVALGREFGRSGCGFFVPMSSLGFWRPLAGLSMILFVVSMVEGFDAPWGAPNHDFLVVVPMLIWVCRCPLARLPIVFCVVPMPVWGSDPPWGGFQWLFFVVPMPMWGF